MAAGCGFCFGCLSIYLTEKIVRKITITFCYDPSKQQRNCGRLGFHCLHHQFGQSYGAVDGFELGGKNNESFAIIKQQPAINLTKKYQENVSKIRSIFYSGAENLKKSRRRNSEKSNKSVSRIFFDINPFF